MVKRKTTKISLTTRDRIIRQFLRTQQRTRPQRLRHPLPRRRGFSMEEATEPNMEGLGVRDMSFRRAIEEGITK